LINQDEIPSHTLEMVATHPDIRSQFQPNQTSTSAQIPADIRLKNARLQNESFLGKFQMQKAA
jgi:hypothetical protein